MALKGRRPSSTYRGARRNAKFGRRPRGNTKGGSHEVTEQRPQGDHPKVPA